MATKVIVKKGKTEFSWGRFKVQAAPYVFVSPFYILFLIFGAFPIGFSFFLSLQDWNGIREMKFVGFNNYIRLVQDIRLWHSIARTLAMMILGMIPNLIMGLFFAFVLNSTFVRGKELFKAVFFLPYVTSSVAIGLLFSLLYGVNYGLFNWFFESKFVQTFLPIPTPIYWLRGYTTILSLTILAIWRWVGWNTILYLSGLQAISKSYYEAALVDGASWPQVFIKITLPLLKPIIFFNVTMGMIGGMQAFDEASILFGRGVGGSMGGADYSGVTAAIYLYNQGFGSGFYGRAAATSYILLIIIISLSRVVSYIFRDKD